MQCVEKIVANEAQMDFGRCQPISSCEWGFIIIYTALYKQLQFLSTEKFILIVGHPSPTRSFSHWESEKTIHGNIFRILLRFHWAFPKSLAIEKAVLWWILQGLLPVTSFTEFSYFLSSCSPAVPDITLFLFFLCDIQ